jgi:hypothetical protein
MRSMSLAEIDCRLSPAADPWNWVEGLPSIRMSTLVSPRNDTMPSGSTSTEGMVLRMSLRLPKVACASSVTL